jgi:hypothetical protein
LQETPSEEEIQRRLASGGGGQFLQRQLERLQNQPIPIYRVMERTPLRGELVVPFNQYDRRRYVRQAIRPSSRQIVDHDALTTPGATHFTLTADGLVDDGAQGELLVALWAGDENAGFENHVLDRRPGVGVEGIGGNASVDWQSPIRLTTPGRAVRARCRAPVIMNRYRQLGLV